MRFGADFSALIDRFSPDPNRPIALAVSGGSDSLALLILSQQWAQAARRDLVVFTVDHGLRAEARQEALTVEQLCQDLGVAHRILRWDRPKPTQSAARAARYGLLACAARSAGATCLLTGHTHDDVVETALIRRRRKVRGPLQAGPVLAAPVPSWPEGRGLALLRPLLNVTRGALRAFLTDKAIPWAEDPSNENPDFERVRVRQFLARHKRLAQAASRYVRTLQSKRSQTDHVFAEDVARVTVRPDGLIESGSAQLTSRLVGLLARCASGSARDPRAAAVAEMLENLTASGMRQTLGGAWFQKSGSQLLIGRDPGPTQTTESGDLFDGRYMRAPEPCLPDGSEASFLVRHALPSGPEWREVISDRLAHIQHCLQTPMYNCIAAEDLILPMQSHDTSAAI